MITTTTHVGLALPCKPKSSEFAPAHTYRQANRQGLSSFYRFGSALPLTQDTYQSSLPSSPKSTLIPSLETMFKPDTKALEAFFKAFPAEKDLSFAGDNFGPADPKFLSVLGASLLLPHMTYQKGGPLLAHSQKVLQKAFTGNTTDPFVSFFCPTGTSAGRLVMMPVLRSVDGIVSADNAHLLNRECGSHHRLNPSSVYSLPTKNGKLEVQAFSDFLKTYDKRGYWKYPNAPKPKVLSLSQPTEYGGAYSDEEVKAFAKMAHDHGMLLHMDGSRLFYLAGKTNKTLKQLTTDLGVDMLFIGGSKNKMAMAEVAIFTPNFFKNAKGFSRHDTPESLALDLKSYAKQYGFNVGQAVGAAAQFAYALESGHAMKLTQKAFEQAQKLEKVLLSVPHTKLASSTETNVVLISMPQEVLKPLREKYEVMVFPDCDKETRNPIVRFMTTGGTTDKEIATLEKDLKHFVSEAYPQAASQKAKAS
jgi:threonine aldolase